MKIQTMLGKLAALFIVASVGQGFAVAQAQVYPDRPIRFITPLPAGTSTDVMIRRAVEAMSIDLGQNIVVENHPGAGGVVGVRHLVGSKPDGYTLGMISNGTLPAAMALQRNVGYGPESFTHIGMFATLPYELVVQKQLPVKSQTDFFNYVRKNPGKLTTAYYVNSIRMISSQLKTDAKLDVVEVPYKSGQQIITDMKAGLIHYAFLPPSLARMAEEVGAGLTVAVTSPKRFKSLPEVPTVSEALPGFEMVAWIAFSGPAGLPAPIADKLAKSLAKVLAEPEVQEKMRAAGGEPASAGADAVERIVRSEIPMWAKFVKSEGIEPQ